MSTSSSLTLALVSLPTISISTARRASISVWLLQLETVALLETDRPEDARRVLHEAQVVQDADVTPLQVAQAPEEVEQLPEALPAQGDGHGVDGEIAAVEVLPDRGDLHRGQGRRIFVELGARGGHIHPDARSKG